MPITRSTVSAHLERNMRIGFLKGIESYTPRSAPFVRPATSDGAFETYADMGATPWPRANGGQVGNQGTNSRSKARVTGGLHEGGPITVLGGNERSLELWNRDWDIPIGIHLSAIEDNRVGGLLDWAQSAGERFAQHKDYLCFNALTQGDNTTSDYGLCYDGLALFSASHVDPGAEYQTAQSNALSVALTPDNFETAYTAANNFLDDRGQPCAMFFDLLIVPHNYRRMAHQITMNPMISNTANNEQNPWQGEIRYIQAPGTYLDSTSWYLCASGGMAKPVILQEREAPSLVTWIDYSQGTGVQYFKWMARYTVGYGEWRSIIRGNT